MKSDITKKEREEALERLVLGEVKRQRDRDEEAARRKKFEEEEAKRRAEYVPECSFCHESDKRNVVSGTSAYICKECAEIAVEMHEELLKEGDEDGN